MRASDIHLVPGYRPQVRVDGELHELDSLLLTPAQTRWVAIGLFGNGADYGHEQLRTSRVMAGSRIADIGASRTGGNMAVTVRFHGGPIPDFAAVELPEATKQLLTAPNGIVILAGPHGSGKTTTLYSVTDWINRNVNGVICTIENPRWFIFEPAKSLVLQHEVGLDGHDVPSLLQQAMRKAPNVLMLGEVENLETLAGVINAAETGHLVLIHMHAKDPRDAVERLVSCAPTDMQPMLRQQLKSTLRGIIVQRLAKRADKGRAPVYEVVNEGARRLADGGTLEPGHYIARAHTRIDELLQAKAISIDEADRLKREFGA
jgi:Tfp pilus assembly pilus retraction ATPase PilT